MKTDLFDYILPTFLIAQTPAPNRSESRLMQLCKNTQTITHHPFGNLPTLLNSNDVLIFNDTKVIKARLLLKKDSGASIEIVLLTPHQSTQTHPAPTLWQALIKNARRLKIKDTLTLDQDTSITLIEKDPSSPIHTIQFNSPHDIWQILETHGHLPLPPYITSPPEKDTLETHYQTIFAKHQGAVAAPTAGLHFTPELLSQLKEANIQTETITLHVGYGTFKPIETDDITTHKMHHETYHISNETAQRLTTAIAQKKRLIAVGTTVVRTLESAWTGTHFTAGQNSTNIFIYPGKPFNVTSALITNFHLPKSTLLCLVSAFAGTDFIKTAYQTAIDHAYRFYSFGDAMLIE